MTTRRTAGTVQQLLYRHDGPSNDRTATTSPEEDTIHHRRDLSAVSPGTVPPAAADDEEGEEEEEQDDTVGPLCTCGQISSAVSMLVDGGDQQPTSSSNNTKKQSTWLESSFVHLMTPRKGSREHGNNNPVNNNNNNKQWQQKNNHHSHQPQQHNHHHHGFLEQHQLMLQLLDAAHGTVDGVELCIDCIDRVAEALEADTQRLHGEIQCYHETVQSVHHRAKALQQQLSMTTAVDSNNNNSITVHQYHLNLDDTEEAYQQEIRMLQSEVQSQYDELQQLKTLHREQMEIARHLEEVDETIQLEQNALELESNAFDNRRQVLTKALTEIQLEVDKLSLVPLPKALFDLQVDPRGLRYPLINQLRLAFRPKGDVPSQEIQVAWSQATQLLLILGTLLEYPSLDWKLVPLADCSKLIYRKEIFNLAPGDCRSLMAWNALLDQVVKHSLSMTASGALQGGGSGGHTTDHHLSYNYHQQHNNYQYHSRKILPSHQDHTIQSTASTSSPPVPPPPFPSSPTSIGDTELARLDRMDHLGWSQVIHRMASNLLWLSDRASELAATQVSGMAQCIV